MPKNWTTAEFRAVFTRQDDAMTARPGDARINRWEKTGLVSLGLIVVVFGGLTLLTG